MPVLKYGQLFFILCIVLSLFVSSARAQYSVEPAPDKFTYGGSFSAVSAYVDYLGYRLSDKYALQTDVFVSSPCGLRGRVWTSIAPDDMETFTDSRMEGDFTGGYATSWQGVDLGLDLLYKDFGPLRSDRGDLLIPGITASESFETFYGNTITPFVHVETDFELTDFEARWVGMAGFDSLVQLSDRCAFQLGGGPMLDQGVDSMSGGLMLHAYGIFTAHITDQLSINVFCKIQGAVVIEDRDNEAVIGTSLALRL